jgi:hypothetical protein
MRPAKYLIPLIVSVLVALTGCGLVPQRYQLAAEPLMDIPPAWAVQPVPPAPPGATPAVFPANVPLQSVEDEVNVLVQDSQRKCAAFVDSLFAETAGAGLTLDVLSTGTSAVAAVVTPLATSHALSAASTVLGATKSGITANYLNTLSLAHITQAILGTYNNDMTDYINSLASTPDPNNLRLYTERTKIENIHKKCSLAAAETTISNTLQTSGSTAAGSGLQKIHTVTSTETDPKVLASTLSGEINDTFGKSGLKAIASGNVITLSRPASLSLTVTSSPTSLVTFVAGPPDLLAIVGKPQKGNTITISGPPAPAPQQTTTGSAGGAGVTGAAVQPGSPPAAIVAPALRPTLPSGPVAITAPAKPAGAPLK